MNKCVKYYHENAGTIFPKYEVIGYITFTKDILETTDDTKVKVKRKKIKKMERKKKVLHKGQISILA